MQQAETRLYYSTETVCKMLDVSRSYLHEATKTGRFPKPVKMGRLNRYKAEDIQAYLVSLSNQSIC